MAPVGNAYFSIEPYLFEATSTAVVFRQQASSIYFNTVEVAYVVLAKGAAAPATVADVFDLTGNAASAVDSFQYQGGSAVSNGQTVNFNVSLTRGVEYDYYVAIRDPNGNGGVLWPAVAFAMPLLVSNEGEVTITGYAPVVSSNIIMAGVGSLLVRGFKPALYTTEYVPDPAIQLSTRYTRNTYTGSGVYRLSRVRSEVRRWFIATSSKQIEVGAGSVSVSGYAPTLTFSEVKPVAGTGTISIQGFGPAITADGLPPIGISAANLETIKQVKRKRLRVSQWKERYARRPDFYRIFYGITKSIPQKIVGPSTAVLTISGKRVTLQKRLSVGSGTLSIIGYGPPGEWSR